MVVLNFFPKFTNSGVFIHAFSAKAVNLLYITNEIILGCCRDNPPYSVFTTSFYIKKLLLCCLTSATDLYCKRKKKTMFGCSFLKGKFLFSVSFSFPFLPLPLSCSYTSRYLQRYVYVLDKLYFPHSHCSTLQHCFSTLSDNGEELLSLTCSHILRSYASRLLTSALPLLHAACSV